MKRLIKILPVAAWIMFLFVSGCSYFSDYTSIRIDLEESFFPWDEYIRGESHTIIYPDPGDPSRPVSLILEPGRMSADIRICKGSAVPVAVYSSAGGKPAGGIFPYDLKKGLTLTISPGGGFLAEMLLSLLSERIRIEAVNIYRLRKALSEKCMGDPWSIDSELLKTSIVLGSMAEYRIKKMETENYEIEGMHGLWVPDSLFNNPVPVDAGGDLSLDLYPGISGFLNPDTGQRLYVSVHDGEWGYILTD